MKFKRLVITLLFFSIIINNISFAENAYLLAGYDGENSSRNWNNNLFFKRCEDRFDLKFTFQQYNSISDWKNNLNTIFANKDFPDALFKASLSKSDQLDLFEKGFLIDLKPLLEKHSKYFIKLYNSDKQIRDSITLVNGAIVCLPTINIVSPQNIIWINNTWLKKLNIPMPTNTDEFFYTLMTFKNSDLNSNGLNDEIPLNFNGIWDLKFLSHAFGVISNDFNIYQDNEKLVHFAPIDNNYYNFIIYLHNLYKNGLLDKTGFEQYFNIQDNNKKENELNKYGVLICPTPLYKLTPNQAKEYVPMPPLSFNGKQIYRSLIGKALSGSFSITNKCQNPEKLIEWIDYLYSEDGGKLISVGLENVEYRFLKNGKWEWLNSSGDNLKNIISNSTLTSTGHAPYLEPYNFQILYDNSDTVKVLNELYDYEMYFIKPTEDFYLSKSNENYIENFQNKIASFVDTKLSQFIIGEIDLNLESWNNYKSELNKLGLNKFVDFWNTILNK